MTGGDQMGKIMNKYTALLLAAAMLSSLPSCVSTVSSVKDGAETAAPETTTEEETTAEPATEAAVTTAAVTTEATTTTVTTTVNAVDKGNIYDVNGTVLVSSTTAADGSASRTYNENYKTAYANILSEMSGGFDYVLTDGLTEPNPTPIEYNENIGQSVRLTLDSDVQNGIYNYMQSNNIVGSVVVMRTDGSIMSEGSYPSFDPNVSISDQNYFNSLPAGACSNKAFQNAAPGSCFKILSSVVADYNGITTLYDDGTWDDNGAVIHNWDYDTNWNYPIAERSLYSAFVDSSNIYFAKAFDNIGTDKVLSDLDSIFNFGTGSDIECDFGPLENSIEITCSDDLRRSAFGQAMVRTCPVYLAAVGREAVFGDMVRPFVVKEYVDTADGYTVTAQGSAPYDYICSIPESCRQDLLDGMSGVTGHIGIYAPDGYTLYTKTGTAEVGAGDYLYITGVLKNSADVTSQGIVYDNYDDYKATGSYVVVMQIQNPEDHNFKFASDSAQLYRQILDIVLTY